MHFMDISVLSTFSFNYFVIYCTFFFFAATNNLVHSVFAGVTNTSDCSGNDELFFSYIGSNLQSPQKPVCDDSFISLCILCVIVHVGWVSSVCIATRSGLNGLGIKSRWGPRHSAPVQIGPGAYPAPYTMGTRSFLGVKWLGASLTTHPI